MHARWWNHLKQEQLDGACRISRCKSVRTAKWSYALFKIKLLTTRQVFKIISHLCAISHCFRDTTISLVYLEKSKSRSIGVTFAMVSFFGKYQNLQKLFCAFRACSHRFKYINISNCLPSSRSVSTFSHWQHSMVNVKFYKRLVCIFKLALIV